MMIISKLILKIQEIKLAELISLFGLLSYNIFHLRKITRPRNLFFLLIFFLIHLISVLNLYDFRINILCIECIFIIFWFKFSKITNFYHFIVLFFFSVLVIFLDNFNLLEFISLEQKYKIKNFNYIILYNVIIYTFHLFFFQKQIFISSNYYLKVFLLYFLIIFSNLTQILFLDKELSKYIIFSIFIYTFYIYLIYKKYINYSNLLLLENKIYIYIILLLIFFNYQIIIFFENNFLFKIRIFFILNFLILFRINFFKRYAAMAKNFKINYFSFLILNINLIISHFYVFFLSLKIRSSILNYSAMGIVLFSFYCLFKYCKILRKLYPSILDRNKNQPTKKNNIDFLSIFLSSLNLLLFYLLNKQFISNIHLNSLYLLKFDKRIIFFILLILFFYKGKNFFHTVSRHTFKIWNFFSRAIKISISSFYISFIEYIFLLKIKSNKIARAFVNMNLENRILNVNNVIFISIILILGLIILNSAFE